MAEVNKPVLIEEMSLGELYKAHYDALSMLRNLQQQADGLNNQIAAINQAIEQKKQDA